MQAYPEFGPARARHTDAKLARADAVAVWEQAACAPLVTSGDAVRTARTHLLDRLEALGHTRTTDPDLRVLAGRRLLPSRIDGEWHEVTVPADADAVRLVSRSARPAELNPDSDDWRTLGVAVGDIRMDEIVVPLDDTRLGDGWLKPEAALSWTDGDAEITVTPGSVVRLHLWRHLQYSLLANARDVERDLTAGVG